MQLTLFAQVLKLWISQTLAAHPGITSRNIFPKYFPLYAHLSEGLCSQKFLDNIVPSGKCMFQAI